MIKKIQNFDFLPKYGIGPDLAEYFSTYAALLIFSKQAQEQYKRTRNENTTCPGEL